LTTCGIPSRLIGRIALASLTTLLGGALPPCAIFPSEFCHVPSSHRIRRLLGFGRGGASRKPECAGLPGGGRPLWVLAKSCGMGVRSAEARDIYSDRFPSIIVRRCWFGRIGGLPSYGLLSILGGLFLSIGQFFVNPDPDRLVCSGKGTKALSFWRGRRHHTTSREPETQSS
jgi:hypothetical protein